MTPEQRAMSQALARVTMCPGIGTKRFARDMAWHAEHQPEKDLTPKQAKYLAEAVVKFRRQIPRDVVDMARTALEQVAA